MEGSNNDQIEVYTWTQYVTYEPNEVILQANCQWFCFVNTGVK